MNKTLILYSPTYYEIQLESRLVETFLKRGVVDLNASKTDAW